jgi:2-polyprenyl-3-methyl-5-hydroxy-6-metoxy-1,4-benzoquinol methylase
VVNYFLNCPLCADASVETVFGFERHCLSRCSTCGLVFDCRRPTLAELSDYYRQYSYGDLKPCSHPTIASFQRLLSDFEAFRHYGTVLDIGCGQGDFLWQARQRGWSAQGSEFSTAAAALCRKRGLSVTQRPLSQAGFTPASFDVITAFEVLEHVNDPSELISSVRFLLRPGGLFYLTTPNFDSLLRFAEGEKFKMLCYPEHLCFYTKSSLSNLARLHNFRLLRLRTTGLDLSRAKNLARGPAQRSSPSNSAMLRKDLDVLRARFQTNRPMGLIKFFANCALSGLGLGDTLKGYLLKNV